MIERIFFQEQLLALIIKSNYEKEGIEFFTPGSFSQQLGYMNRPIGYKIPPHVHNPVAREIVWTQEVLFIKTGKIRVDFYDEDKNYLESKILEKGDIILLAGGGHGFEMIEQTEMVEVKQGPYCGELDKTRFITVEDDMIRYKNE
ncbi:MAG: hypothetical protein IT279_10565 [Ignavibacteriaceae bacterium]|nr:hypothetical protein [Ignavibacteriaceae bacterium]